MQGERIEGDTGAVSTAARQANMNELGAGRCYRVELEGSISYHSSLDDARAECAVTNHAKAHSRLAVPHGTCHTIA